MLQENSPLLHAQRVLLGLIDDTGDQPAWPAVYPPGQADVRQILTDIKLISARVLAAATDEDLARWAPSELVTRCRGFLARLTAGQQHRRVRPGWTAPADAAATAIAITAAVHILSAPDIGTAGQRVAWLIERSTGGRVITPSQSADWGREISPTLREILCSPGITELRSSDRLRYSTPLGTLQLLRSGTDRAIERARKTPAMIWPRWALHLTPRTAASPRAAARSLSACLLRVGSRASHREAAGILGATTSTYDAASHLLRLLRADPGGPDALKILTLLARHLDEHGSPIDSARRREMFGSREQFVSGRRRTAIHHNPQQHHKNSIIHAQQWLFEILTGSPAETAPTPIALTAGQMASYQDFRRRLLPPEAEALGKAAAELLADHAIDEPLAWEPRLPSDSMNGLTLPGPDPDGIDPAQVEELALAQDLYPQQIAERLGATVEHIRYLHDLHPIDWLAAPQASHTATERWRTWYVTDGWSLRQIAHAAKTEKKDVAAALRGLGVAIRSQGQRRRYDHRIEEIIHRHTALGQDLTTISAETGIPRTTVGHMLDRAGVPRRPPNRRKYDHLINEVISRYTTDGQTMNEIAKTTGIPSTTVATMLDRADTPREKVAAHENPKCNSPETTDPMPQLRRPTKVLLGASSDDISDGNLHRS
jgi:hypothetical protein